MQWMNADPKPPVRVEPVPGNLLELLALLRPCRPVEVRAGGRRLCLDPLSVALLQALLEEGLQGELVPLREAAARAGVEARTVLEWARQGRLRPRLVYGRSFYSLREVLEQRLAQGTAAPPEEEPERDGSSPAPR